MDQQIIINRNKDLIYGNEDLEFLFEYNKFPCFMGCVDTDFKNDLFFDMRWFISKKSGMIQLNPLLPLDLVYQKSHFSGTIGETWDNHHEDFSKFINKYSPKKVLEIGGFHEILANKCFKHFKCEWTIIDPSVNFENNSNIKKIKGFFDENFVVNDDYDTIIHSHLIEHVYDINIFLNTISNILKEKAKIIFSVPDLKKMLKNKSTNVLNFEHTYYISEDFLDFLLAKHKFITIEKHKYTKNNSIFYCVEKTKKALKHKLKENLYKINKNLFLKSINKNINEIKKINSKINKSNSNIYLFGAHIFSQNLINNGLDVSKIKFILDNDHRKQNKRLYGSNLIVKSPSILKEEESPIVILKTGVYNTEIKQKILTEINSKTKFLE